MVFFVNLFIQTGEPHSLLITILPFLGSMELLSNLQLVLQISGFLHTDDWVNIPEQTLPEIPEQTLPFEKSRYGSL